MGTLSLSIAFGPFAAYLMLLGVIHLSRRPLVTTGARDLAALGVGLSGFALMGPLALFTPEPTVQMLKIWVWGALLIFYGLCVCLLTLLLPPRLIVYNWRADQVRPVLAQLVSRLDRRARWAGQCLWLPTLGLQLFVHIPYSMNIVQLKSIGSDQNYPSWRRLERELIASLRDVRGSRGPYGYLFVSTALFILGLLVHRLSLDTESVAQAWQEMMRL